MRRHPFQIARYNAAEAYLVAVSVSALFFAALLAMHDTPSRGAHGTIFPTLLPQLESLLLAFVLSWIGLFLSALLPFVGAITVAHRFEIAHWSYYVGGAAATGAVCVSRLELLAPYSQGLDPR